MIFTQYGGMNKNTNLVQKFVKALTIFFIVILFPIAPIALVFIIAWKFFNSMIIDNIKKL